MEALAEIASADSRALVDLVASGDERAFAEIVRRFHDDMRRVCKVVVGDEQIADEAVEAAWAIAWRKIDTVRDTERLRPWLVSVAVNEARRLVRSQRRVAVSEIALADVAEPAGGVDPAERISVLDLRNALNRLTEEERALLAMRYVAGFDSTELGIATGRSASGTRARIGRLLSRLERDLTGEMGNG